MLNRFDAHLHRHLDVALAMRETIGPVVADAAALLVGALKSGHKVMLCGNGGSAADAQHIAAELTGRYEVPSRRALPALALSTDSSALTAISNDLGFDRIFVRQIEALGQPGDVLVAISTSGRSPNVIAAVDCARSKAIKTIGLLGRDGGDLRTRVDHAIIIPSQNTPHIQEMHIMVGHVLCALIDDAFGNEHQQDGSV